MDYFFAMLPQEITFVAIEYVNVSWKYPPSVLLLSLIDNIVKLTSILSN